MKKEARKPYSRSKKNQESNLNRYEKDYSWSAKEAKTAKDVRTTTEMVAFLESPAGKNVELESRVFAHSPTEGYKAIKLNKKSFLEAFRKNSDGRKRFREAYNGLGGFSSGGIGPPYANTVGQDFTPLLGGPFYKQLYYYNDWLTMHQDCFFAMNHDPMGKAAINIITNFCLGKGYKLEFDSPVHQALWDAFEEANDFQETMRTFCRELSGYGENMFWKLPNKDRYIDFPVNGIKSKGDVPKALIPRIRLVDPSNIVEIITYPEDITRKLFYVWLTPTQYQIYTAKDPATGQVVNSTKFIYQQIPADQMLHYKVNAVSNEKRGRSDLFPGLPYLKRLRDSVNYEIIGLQKNAAWAIDTVIRGDQTDVDNYISAQESLGTIPNAGSEFVHTEAITRQYLANQGTSRGASNAFDWCMSMFCASVNIPVSYFGSHLSGGQTRASALVATEPVAKNFEMRQNVLRGVLSDVAKWYIESWGIKNAQFEVHLPELYTQDRSQKMQDAYFGQTAGWWSKERAAETAAAEMGYKDYDFQAEQEKIAEHKEEAMDSMLSNPLSGPVAPGGGNNFGSKGKPAQMGGDEKKAVKDDETE